MAEYATFTGENKCSCFWYETLEKTQFGRPSHRWGINNRSRLGVCVADSSGTYDRDLCGAPVMTPMNFHIP